MEKGERRLRVLMSGMFIIYLIFQEIVAKDLIVIRLLIVCLFIIVMMWHYYLEREEMRNIKPIVKPIVKPTSLPPGEVYVFSELGHLMKENGLEMRIRIAEQGWNVTFLTNEGGVHRIMGRGSGPTITEALGRAEDDFDEKKG